MDIDGLSIKQQLELKIFKMEAFIEEDNLVLDYCKFIYEREKNDNSSWSKGVTFAFKDLINRLEERKSDYKERIYKFKDQLYNLPKDE